ncbi:MAG: hypothetical protein ACI8RZ_002151 [Myxococcota bacterium]|jgi:hypothetical protein
MSFSRRKLLTASSALLAATALPNRARAAAAGDLKFIFVMSYGGWDPTRVFATTFDNQAVDMEDRAELSEVGGLSYVSHTDRPSVDSFLSRYADQAMILNGLLVPSVAHTNCLKLAMTGTSSDASSDWPAILAAAQADRYPLPHLVVEGPSYPGDLGSAVTRTGSSGQLEALLSGEIIDWSDTPASRPETRAEDTLDRYLERRISAASSSAAYDRKRAMLSDYGIAHEQAIALKDLRYVINWSADGAFYSNIRLGVSALSMGISRCITLAFATASDWDTHVENDEHQSELFEGLFSGLIDLMDLLNNTTGTTMPTMADETVVVVLSEMGRTPRLNLDLGKDHWPYTSALLLGPGINSGRVIGGFDDYYYGHLINPATGEQSATGVEASSASLGAALLQLGSVDPGGWLPGVTPLTAILR